jgi:hypothetical protein
VGRPDGKTPLGRSRNRLKEDIKMDLQYVDWGGMVWDDLTQVNDRWWGLMNAVMNLRVS